MAKMKQLKRSLIASCLALTVSASALVGTTFAWFTDSVSSANNIIKSGNLDVDVYYGNPADKQSIQDVTTLFNDVTLWEPGAVAYENLTVANLGSLALKYEMAVNFKDANYITGTEYSLDDILQVGFVEGGLAAGTTRENAIAEVDYWMPMESFSIVGTLEAGKSAAPIAIVIYWEPSAEDNNYNVNNGKTTSDGEKFLHINLGIEVKATQYTHESDSFDKNYDSAAEWYGGADISWYNETESEYIINNAEELAGLAALVNGIETSSRQARSTTLVQDSFKGKTFKLAGDINLNDIPWEPIGNYEHPFLGDFDGQGHTVYNLYVDNAGWSGLFGHAGKAAGSNIQNVSVVNAEIKTNRMAGAIVGQLYGNIENCHVSNVTITAIPNEIAEGQYDNGDKVGGIVGWLGDNGNNHYVKACTAENVNLTAYRDIGGIAGYVASSTTVENNVVKGQNTIKVDQFTNNYGAKDPNAGAIFGRKNGAIVENNNKVEETEEEKTEITSCYYQDGLQYVEEDGEVSFYCVPADYKGETVTVAEGTTTIGNYAFAYNSNVKEVILPESVKDLGRGFDSAPSVEKVVLNEGLETISSRAFRNTYALKEVVFSSTVKTIADNAFQKSSIKSITIPETVETIGETAFGSSLLEEVIFEGNTSIQGYAFRGCTKLTTVVMHGNNDFIPSTLNGRNSMWFCNGESNNPNTSSISFYIYDEAMEAKIKTAMGAEANNTPIILMNNNTEIESEYTKIQDGVYTHNVTGAYALSNAAGWQWMIDQTDAFFAGKTITLIDNIDFDGAAIQSTRFWDPEHKTIFDGQGFTVSNFSQEGNVAGMFSGVVDVKNLVVNNATVKGTYVGVIAGNMYGNLENVTVKNSKIIGTYWQTGALVGQYNAGSIKGCIVDGCTIEGLAAVGALVGIINENAVNRNVENCIIKNNTITQTGSFGGDYDDMFGVAVGLINIAGDGVVVNFNNCTLKANTLKGAASSVLYGVSECTVKVNGK